MFLRSRRFRPPSDKQGGEYAFIARQARARKPGQCECGELYNKLLDGKLMRINLLTASLLAIAATTLSACGGGGSGGGVKPIPPAPTPTPVDRKSTRLKASHTRTH